MSLQEEKQLLESEPEEIDDLREQRKNTISNLSGLGGANSQNMSSSDSRSFRNVNEIIQQSKTKDFSLTYLESSFSSHSSRKVAPFRKNIIEEKEIKRKAKLQFMVKLMILYIIFFILLVVFLTYKSVTTSLGFLANEKRLGE